MWLRMWLRASRGAGAAGWITIAMVIAALGTLNSSLLSGARVPYAMARDGLFFRVTGIVHPKFRTPGGALIFQGTLAGLMALTGTFEELTSLFVFAAWIFYALSVVAMFRLRRISPAASAALSDVGLSGGAGAVCGWGRWRLR